MTKRAENDIFFIRSFDTSEGQRFARGGFAFKLPKCSSKTYVTDYASR